MLMLSRRHRILFAVTALLVIAGDFRFVDGDRVVFVGNTLIEREQRTSYWETMVTSRHPKINVTFRNLGWSGDTVWGEARASFGTAADGFRVLKEHVLALKPTVIFVAYGGNEAYAGEAGLPRFLRGMGVLLDALAETKARIVLLGPIRHEDLGRPLPDPGPINRLLALYRDALLQVSEQRHCAFVDLYDLPGRPALTDDGMHLTAYGYWRSADTLAHGLGMTTGVLQADEKGLRFRLSRNCLPSPPLPTDGPVDAPPPPATLTIRVPGLAPGDHALFIDGKKVAFHPAADWAAGVTVSSGPDIEHAERLRHAIVEKNLLYFHRWRPENETYLFGFRKYEQGQNAREIPLFDPLVAKKEAEIAKLRVPVEHDYELVPEAK
jgi:lysophospholipase L1-like esterase